jgi:hypothetical protein
MENLSEDAMIPEPTLGVGGEEKSIRCLVLDDYGNHPAWELEYGTQVW